jgi:hypothetical protein
MNLNIFFDFMQVLNNKESILPRMNIFLSIFKLQQFIYYKDRN